jgi:hypothetical protein
MSPALRALESFLALSETMARAADAQEWEDLVRFGEERGALSDKLPTNLGAQLPPAEQARARTIIERCRQLDVQTRSLVGDRHKALRVLLRDPISA